MAGKFFHKLAISGQAHALHVSPSQSKLSKGGDRFDRIIEEDRIIFGADLLFRGVRYCKII